MASAPITLLYDEGRMFQDCLTVIRQDQKAGNQPTCIRMNVNTAQIILNQCEHPFKKNSRVFIKIGNLPVKLSASLADNYILLGYEP